jgi:hypothetical protein
MLHRQVADALERSARAQRESRRLLAHHRELDAALRSTLAAISERRRFAAERPPDASALEIRPPHVPSRPGLG